MTALQIAKSRTTARTETHVGFRGDVANSEWEGLAVTIGGGGTNGGTWGSIEQPKSYFLTASALAGSATSATINGGTLTGAAVWSGGVFIDGALRVYRPVNGTIDLIRSATITGQAADYWSVSAFCLGKVVTGNSLEHRFDTYNALGSYTFGVARIQSGLIGPVATVTVNYASAATTLDPVAPASGATLPTITGRNGSLPAVTGLTAEIRSGATRNVQLSWDAGDPDTFVVFINWDGTNDRLPDECTLSFASGAAVQAGDMLVFESAPILSLDPNWISRRVRTLNNAAGYGPQSVTFEYPTNLPGGRTWQYVAYSGGDPKPDITFPNYFLRLNGTTSLPARAERFFHAGTDQDFYDTLVPGRIYRARFRARAASAVNATFSVQNATVVAPATVALTTSWQEFDFDFTRDSLLKTATPQSWSFTGATNNVSIELALVQVWDTTRPHNALMNELPEGIDVRDHNLIKEFPPPSLDAITSRSGFGPRGWSLASLLAICASDNCNPHFQIEWLYDDQFYYDLVTFLYAPASSNEPLALKREALGFGPVNVEFSRHLYEDGNERWNSIMWQMFFGATDSVTAEAYSIGDLSAMFANRRRAIMESNPYWPTVNPPKEFAGGWIMQPTYTTEATVGQVEVDYTSVAMYTAGWDVNRVLVSDAANRFSEVLVVGQNLHRPLLETTKSALLSSGVKLAVYEAGPGYQLNGLNGAAVTTADTVVQECFAKSIASVTATMSSAAIAATLGYGPYNFFTWGEGPLWQAARRPSEGGGLYRVASFLKQTHELLGRCVVRETNNFIDRTRDFQNIDTNGNPTTITQVERAAVYHFESLTYPGRVGILFVNTTVNLDAFGVGHPDYQAGVTGAANFRYHTGLPTSATPFKVLRNEGNMRHHDAYKVGFRPNVVGSAIDDYVADPLCVDLTVTPEDFTVDDVQIRELTLLGGNCRLEVFNA
jgi:hypothetical protein